MGPNCIHECSEVLAEINMLKVSVNILPGTRTRVLNVMVNVFQVNIKDTVTPLIEAILL